MAEKADFPFRRIAKIFPKPIRHLFGYLLDYLKRVLRWRSILRDIRGVSVRDQFVLFVSALASPLTSLGRIGQWQDPVLLWDAVVRVEGIGGFLLRRQTDDLWHVFPSRESAVLSTIQKHLKPGSVFIDAGANIGVYTVLASQLVGDRGRVIAVEMMPATANILRRHISMNRLGNVVVIDQALTDVAGKRVIARVPKGKYGQASIAAGNVLEGVEEHVETITLAEILAGIETVALLKMDLEGAEELALIGAGGALNKIGGVIFEDWGNTRLSEIFIAKGFKVERLDGNNCLATNLAALHVPI